MEVIDRSERRTRLDRAWGKFLVSGEVHDVAPEIAKSWRRAREIHSVDPRMTAAPVLPPEELGRRLADSDVLPVAGPVLDEFAGRMRGEGQILAWFDPEGVMLWIGGDAAIVAEIASIHFHPGSVWREDAVGTTAVGVALAEGRAAEVFASEHYVQAWQDWACAAAPVYAPGSPQPLGAVCVTSPWDVRVSHLMLASAIAGMVQERVRGIHSVLDETFRHALQAARATGDALLVVDARGHMLSANHAGHRRLAADDSQLPDGLRASVAAVLRGRAPHEETTFGWPAANDPDRRVACEPVLYAEQPVGAILRLVAPRGQGAQGAVRGAAGGGRTAAALPSSRYGFGDILGASEPLLDAIALAHVAARNDLPVVLHGESGTGKELFAHGIHGESVRGGGPFVAVNCGAIPATLIEAELFGYEPGTFTGGQREGKAGKLEEAHGGTLFLDEVSELSHQAQTVLLRVLQESEVVRLGGNVPRRVDVRVIVATNKNLAAEVGAGRFRQDLFFRLHVLAIDIPPLRQREGDVAILARAFLAEAEERIGRSGLGFSQEALAALAAHSWPGNVRELRNVVLRAAAVTTTPLIQATDLRLVAVGGPVLAASAGAPVAAAPGTAPGAAAPRRDDGARTPAPRPSGFAAQGSAAMGPLGPVGSYGPAARDEGDRAAGEGGVGAGERLDPAAERERDELVAALEASGWNIAKTATNLGVSRMTLYRRLRKFDISR